MIPTARSAASAVALLGFAIALAPETASATTCNSVSACVFGTNTGKGYGVEGSAQIELRRVWDLERNSGVVGTTTHNATSSGNGKSGVSGYDSTTNKNGYNSGVYGFSAYGNGVHGKSNSGNGVLGESASDYNGSGVSGSAPNGYGVSGYGSVGVNASTPGDEDAGYFYVGLRADSYAVEGTGVQASGGEYGIAAYVDDTENALPGAALYATGLGPAPGILADTEVIDTGSNLQDSLDIITQGSGSGISIFNEAGSGTTVSLGNGKTLITARGITKDVMSLDVSGNLILAGKLEQHGSPKIVLQRADGTSVSAYGSSSADPTIEDVGEASVRGGVATVPLDPSFAGTVNFARPYFVFLTPEGENAGLYVSAKTPRGFVVREVRGARSTLHVQYRIVASPLDDRAATRLQSIAASLPAEGARNVAKFRQLRERDNVARQRFAKLKKEHGDARVVRG